MGCPWERLSDGINDALSEKRTNGIRLALSFITCSRFHRSSSDEWTLFLSRSTPTPFEGNDRCKCVLQTSDEPRESLKSRASRSPVLIAMQHGLRNEAHASVLLLVHADNALKFRSRCTRPTHDERSLVRLLYWSMVNYIQRVMLDFSPFFFVCIDRLTSEVREPSSTHDAETWADLYLTSFALALFLFRCQRHEMR